MRAWIISTLAAGFVFAAVSAQAEPNDRDHARAHNVAVQHRATGRIRVAADERKDTEKRVTVQRKPNKTVRRSVTERPNGNVVQRSVTERGNGNVVGRSVTDRANGNRNISITRRVFRAPRRFHASRPWTPPRGFSYRRFSLGERVPSILLAADYFLSDYFDYGLTPPPPGYVWVRDGTDAVLVDQSTGEVVQVEYDVFY
jgi:Ni/Co efflux regulator RcnB